MVSSFAAQVYRMGDLHPESGIAGAVGSQFPAIDVDSGNVASAVKLQKQPLPFQFHSQFQPPPVTTDHLVRVMVCIMLRQFLYRVGQAHLDTGALSRRKSILPVLRKFPMVIQTVHAMSPFDYSCLHIFVRIPNLRFGGIDPVHFSS